MRLATDISFRSEIDDYSRTILVSSKISSLCSSFVVESSKISTLSNILFTLTLSILLLYSSFINFIIITISTNLVKYISIYSYNILIELNNRLNK